MGGLPSLPVHVVSKNVKCQKMSGNACGDMGNRGHTPSWSGCNGSKNRCQFDLMPRIYVYLEAACRVTGRFCVRCSRSKADFQMYFTGIA